MIGRIALSLATLAFAMPIAVANAQDGWTGTRLPSDQPGNVFSAGVRPEPRRPLHASVAEQGGEIARHTAACLVTRAPKQSEALVMAPDDSAQKKLIGSLQSYMPSCMVGRGEYAAGQMRLSSTTLVGMIAEVLVQKRGRQPIAAIAPKRDYTAPWTSGDASEKVVDEMAVCLAERAPEKVADVLWTDQFSSGEASAVTAMQPDIGPCLQSGATLKTNRLGLRVALARAYFYRTITPQAAATASR